MGASRGLAEIVPVTHLLSLSHWAVNGAHYLQHTDLHFCVTFKHVDGS